LADPTNTREIKGKTIEQLEADAAYFKAVSEGALRLLNRL
jgi:hypothetical protein